MKNRIHSFRALIRAIADRLYSHEIATIVYLSGTNLLVLARTAKIDGWQQIFLFHLFLIALIVAISRMPENLPVSVKMVRRWYLFFLFPMLFKELTILAQSLFPYYLEPALIRSELFFISMHQEKFAWIAQTPMLNELMAFSYWSYFVLIFGVGFYLYKVVGESELDFYLFRIYTTFLICYSIFILIPVRGPHHAMANVDPTSLDGYLFQSIILFMQSKGSTVGAAFPSSHVAVAWICIFPLRQFNKRAYYLLMPLMILLTISVFYLRYHYFLDAIFGYFLAIWLERRYIWVSEKLKVRSIEKKLATDAALKPEYEFDNRL